jgi:hypothetical protein
MIPVFWIYTSLYVKSQLQKHKSFTNQLDLWPKNTNKINCTLLISSCSKAKLFPMNIGKTIRIKFNK